MIWEFRLKIFLVFGKVWVGATFEKSKYRLPRFLGQKFWVVPWISIYVKKSGLKILSKIYLSCAKNICRLQNNMKPFHCLFVSPTSSPIKYEQPISFSGLSELLRFYLYPLYKIIKISKVTKWDVNSLKQLCL